MGPAQSTRVSGATVVRNRHELDVPSSTETGWRRIRSGLRLSGPRLALVFVCGLVVSIAGDIAIGALSRKLLGVPGSFDKLKVPGLIPYAVPPVVACTVAFIVAFVVKKPGPHSRHVFLTVGVKFALLDGLIAVLTMPGSANVGSYVGTFLVILFPLLIMPAQLRFVPRRGSSPPLVEPAQAQVIAAA